MLTGGLNQCALLDPLVRIVIGKHSDHHNVCRLFFRQLKSKVNIRMLIRLYFQTGDRRMFLESTQDEKERIFLCHDTRERQADEQEEQEMQLYGAYQARTFNRSRCCWRNLATLGATTSWQ